MASLTTGCLHATPASLHDLPPRLPAEHEDSHAIAITFGIIESLIALASLAVAILTYRRQARF